MANNKNLHSCPQSICIFRLSAIGDVSHIVPVVKTLQQHFPKSQITWVVGATEAKLLDGLADVELLPFNKNEGWSAVFKLWQALRKRKFDVLLQMQLSFRANLLSRLVRAKRRVGFDKNRAKELHALAVNERIEYRDQLHVLDGFMQFAEHLGCNPVFDWALPVSDEDKQLAAQLLFGKQGKLTDKPYVLISPCSSHPLRNWAVENYAILADYLVEKYQAEVVLCGSPAKQELDFVAQIEHLCRRPVRNIAGKDSLKQLWQMMRLADLVISPDSGPLHIAGAVGTPVIGLLAASNYRRSGSYRFAELTVDAYPQACEQFLGKKVSQLKWGKKVEQVGAMDLITPQMVFEKVAMLWSH